MNYKGSGLAMGQKTASPSLVDKHKDSKIVNGMLVAWNRFTQKNLADFRSSLLRSKDKLKKVHLNYWDQTTVRSFS